MNNINRQIPERFLCPILCEPMTDPVIASDGHTYQRTGIVEWIKRGNRKSPLNGSYLTNTIILDNIFAKNIINEYLENNPQEEKGIKSDLDECIKNKEEMIDSLIHKIEQINIEKSKCRDIFLDLRNESIDLREQIIQLNDTIIKLTKANIELHNQQNKQIDSQLFITNDNSINKAKYNQILIPQKSIIRVFDQSINQIRKLNGHHNYVRCLCKLNEHHIASGSVDTTIKIWDIQSGLCKKTLQGHNGSVRTLTSLQNGFLASGSFDMTIKIWDQDYTCIKTLLVNYWINCLFTMHNGWLVSGSSECRIKIWNTNYNCIYMLEGHTKSVLSIKQLPDNDLVSISSDQRIIIWSCNDGNFKKLKEYDTGSQGCSLCIIPNNRIVAGLMDNTILIWDASTMECLAKLIGHSGPVYAPYLLSNGQLLSFASNKEVIVWKPSNDSNIFTEWKRISNEGGEFYSMIEI